MVYEATDTGIVFLNLLTRIVHGFHCRKMFNKMKLETIRQNDGNVVAGQANVIATLRNLPDKNEIFSVLTRSNSMFNKNNIKFAANGDTITLNGVAVDISQFGALSKPEQTTFVLQLPATPQPTVAQTKAISKIITNIFNVEFINICGELVAIPEWNFATILNLFQPMIQEMLLKCLKIVLNSIEYNLVSTLKTVCPEYDVLKTILNLVIDFFKTKTIQEQREKQLTSPDFDETFSASGCNDNKESSYHALLLFEKVVALSFSGDELKIEILRELSAFVMNWVSEQIFNYQQTISTRERRGKIRTAQKCCVCGGLNFRRL